MDADRFDAYVRSFPAVTSRRAALGAALTSLLIALGSDGGAARKKKRKKKKRCAAPRVICGKACCAVGESCRDGVCGAAQSSPPQSPPQVPPSPPPPPPRPVGPGACGYDGTSGGFQTRRRVAQTFLAPAAGLLTAAAIGLRGNDAGVSLTFEIRAVDGVGAPTNTVLATETVSNIPQTNPAEDPIRKVVATFSTPATLELGQTYALSITPPDAFCIFHINFGGNFCADGALFRESQATGLFVVSGSGDDDMVFTLTVV